MTSGTTKGLSAFLFGRRSAASLINSHRKSLKAKKSTLIGQQQLKRFPKPGSNQVLIINTMPRVITLFFSGFFSLFFSRCVCDLPFLRMLQTVSKKQNKTNLVLPMLNFNSVFNFSCRAFFKLELWTIEIKTDLGWRASSVLWVFPFNSLHHWWEKNNSFGSQKPLGLWCSLEYSFLHEASSCLSRLKRKREFDSCCKRNVLF